MVSIASARKRKRVQPGWSVPPRVLLVDDDSIFRRLSTRLLQLAGCTIDVAVDGIEAVSKLGTGKYDLVLMVNPHK
jgi:osomolarity two-component system response regulator SKN7